MLLRTATPADWVHVRSSGMGLGWRAPASQGSANSKCDAHCFKQSDRQWRDHSRRTLEIDWAIFVKQEFAQAGKGPMARHFSRIQDDAFEERMPFLETLMIEIVSYLFPEADQHGGVIQDEVASLSAATPASRNLSGLRRSAISSSCSSAQVTTICTALE